MPIFDRTLDRLADFIWKGRKVTLRFTADYRTACIALLAYANATGLGHDCPVMARLAVILSPYWKWGYPHLMATRLWMTAASRLIGSVRLCAPC